MTPAIRNALIAFIASAVVLLGLVSTKLIADSGDDVTVGTTPGTGVTTTIPETSLPGTTFIPNTTAPTTSTTRGPTTTTPVPTTIPGACPLTVAAKSCWQGKTGYKGNLTPSGSITVTQQGQIIENVVVTGCIAVKANNVIIRNVYVKGGGCKGGDGKTAGSAIDTGSSATTVKNLTITDTELENNGGNGIGTSEWTCTRCKIHGFENGVWMSENAKLIDSMIYEQCACGQAHTDGVQADTAHGAYVTHSWIAMLPGTDFTNAAVFFADSYGPGGDYHLTDSFVAGGMGAGFAGGNASRPPHSSQEIARNAFSNQTGNNGTKFYTGRIQGSPNFIWTGNYVAETGAPL